MTLIFLDDSELIGYIYLPGVLPIRYKIEDLRPTTPMIQSSEGTRERNA